MLTHPKTLRKIALVVNEYLPLRYERHGEVPCEFAETTEHFRREPDAKSGLRWKPIKPGTRWGGSGVTGWFRGDFQMPAHLAGKPVFLQFDFRHEPAPLIIEALLLLDGDYKGVLNPKHSEVLLTAKAGKATRHHIAIEAYSGHNYPSTQPHDKPVVIAPNGYEYGGVHLVTEREDVSAFIFDMQVLLKLIDMLDPNSLRRGEITRTLQEVWAMIPGLPHEVPESEWRPALARARKRLAPVMAAKNGDTAPTINVVAHSHMDTAWLWTIAETRRKCARTFSSMANLLDRYPEVIFMQSAPCHADFVRQDYPEIFAKIKTLVRKGRWEPNGAAWIEPDCNLIGGEAFIRQFLKGIRWTREHYGYSPDTFWQPDVFGYSAAIPQILKGFNIDYFCTTKMAWNDTSRFPYDTFEWQGLDGSRVLTHLNSLPQWIDSDEVVKMWNFAQHKDSETKRLASYGWGDGGGGPTSEDMERIRRMENLEGMPRVEYTTVSTFMKDISTAETPWPTWVGELYLELHRGTLTSMAAIKRGNRLGELRLRDAEILHTVTTLGGAAWPAQQLSATWGKLLINQFHDILPGTSIADANVVALREFGEILAESAALVRDGLTALAPVARKPEALLIANTLSWDRTAIYTLTGLPKGLGPSGSGVVAQEVTRIDGSTATVVTGAPLPAMGSAILPLAPIAGGKSPFKLKASTLETPHGRIRFDKKGRISSYEVGSERREIVAKGGLLNGLVLGEDVPDMWDNWDIDPDQERLMKPAGELVSREVVADGALQLRIRSVYTLGRGSRLTQDLVVHADTPRIDFETQVDWRESHQLLKVAFDLDLHAESAKHEVQFGHLDRPTHRNLPQDRARFEVCCHKWSDLSDGGFGVALLNDCKYGISVHGGRMALTLIKSGTHPDPCADQGAHHVFTYSLLPHDGVFSVERVVRPAYELNVAPLAAVTSAGTAPFVPLVQVDSPTVIVESVKWAEDGGGYIVRLYEAGRCAVKSRITLRDAVSVHEANMLEEPQSELALKSGAVETRFRPFEIKTLLCKVKRSR